jgi:hypothetical protein
MYTIFDPGGQVVELRFANLNCLQIFFLHSRMVIMRKIGAAYLVGIPLCALLGLGALFSCGPRAVGYGAVLWGDSGLIVATGSVVKVIELRESDNICLLSLPGESTPVEFSAGRLRIFSKRSEAEEYAKSIEPFLTAWAFSQKQDPPPLPIRETAKTSAEAVYKLRQGQVVKVIGRTEKKEYIKPYEDYWYELVTDDGFTGWCYGHYLKVFSAEGDPTATATKLLSEDETLDRILGSVWRPDWFREMMNEGMIDLQKFREDVGFFPAPSENLFRLVLPAYSVDFAYTGIERLSAGNYEAAGSGLRIIVLDEERIMLNYQHKNMEVGGIYAVVEEDIAETIVKEQTRREDIFNALLAKGSGLKSTAYGTIRLESGMRFSWNGFDRLVPSVIAAGTGNAGGIDYPFHLAKQLSGTYDGVITFVFDQPGTASAARSGASSVSGTSFLYSSAGGGLRLTSLANDSFSDLEVIRVPISPIVVFFTQAQSP